MKIACATLGLVLSTLMSNAGYSVPVNGLIGYWPGSNTALDLSPTGNDGSFGGVYARGGPVGGGSFDLSTGKVTIASVTNYDFQLYDGWSVGFWFNGNGQEINATNGLFLGQDEGPGYKPKWFIDYSYTVYGNYPYYHFHVNDYNMETIFIPSTAEAPATDWNQLTVTIDNTNNSRVSFYLNGQPIGSVIMGPYVLETSANLLFGRAEGFSFNGLMSEVVIYNRVLSFEEVTQLATATTDSPFIITSETPDGNGNIVITWESIPGTTYQVVSARSLRSPITWTNTGRPVLATDISASATIPLEQSPTFFRIKSP